jgi:hypothetical protein
MNKTNVMQRVPATKEGVRADQPTETAGRRECRSRFGRADLNYSKKKERKEGEERGLGRRQLADCRQVDRINICRLNGREQSSGCIAKVEECRRKCASDQIEMPLLFSLKTFLDHRKSV